MEDLKKCNNNEIDCGMCMLSDFYPLCPEKIGEYALDLINRLQAENERLKNAYKQCAFERDAYIEIENTAIAEAKAEAYKEFAKFCIDKSKNGVIQICDLPDYVKEIVGDDNESKD